LARYEFDEPEITQAAISRSLYDIMGDTNCGGNVMASPEQEIIEKVRQIGEVQSEEQEALDGSGSTTVKRTTSQ
jgi:hypothetical protein